MDSTENVRRSPVSEPPSILSKAFGVLRAFDSVNRVMTLSEIARASGLPKSTVHRLLARLLELDVVELHGDSGYKIGLGLLQIGAVSPAISMRDKAMPYLHSLSRWTRCEVQLAYAIGVAEPVSVLVDTFGTGKVSEEKLSTQGEQLASRS